MSSISRALITGASSGIGLSYARRLARAGSDLVLVARREDRLNDIAGELRDAHGVEVEVLAADLGEAADVARVADRLGAGPAVDLLVNNAGYAARGPVADLDDAALAAMLAVNVVALAQLSHAALRRMRDAGGGTIINVASGTAFLQMPGNAGYGSSKSLVVAFTRTMQVEAKGTGVRVQLLVPGVIATDFHEVAGTSIDRFPPDRVMQVDDLVRASLRAIAMEELICIPSLPDVRDWDAYVAAERALAANVSRDTIAARYREA